MSTIGFIQALQSHCLCMERESPSETELMLPRRDFSMGIGDVLPKNKVRLPKMIDGKNSQNRDAWVA